MREAGICLTSWMSADYEEVECVTNITDVEGNDVLDNMIKVDIDRPW